MLTLFINAERAGCRRKEFEMAKTLGTMLLLVGLCQFASGGAVAAPEINPESGVAAFALLSGALLVIRGRRKG